jgi:hypothetical protein
MAGRMPALLSVTLESKNSMGRFSYQLAAHPIRGQKTDD